MKEKTIKSYLPLTQTALLCSVSIILSFIENMLPPIPFMPAGMRLGLSNIATVFALEVVSLPSAIIVVLFKALFALITRGVTAAIMSFCGSILSCFCMYFILKTDKLGYISVGVSGAFCHNLGQILVAFVIIGKAVISYFPVLCLVSIITGIITAIVIAVTLPAVKRIKYFNPS